MRRCLQEQAIKDEETEYTGRLKVDSGRMRTEERHSKALHLFDTKYIRKDQHTHLKQFLFARYVDIMSRDEGVGTDTSRHQQTPADTRCSVVLRRNARVRSTSSWKLTTSWRKTWQPWWTMVTADGQSREVILTEVSCHPIYRWPKKTSVEKAFRASAPAPVLGSLAFQRFHPATSPDLEDEIQMSNVFSPTRGLYQSGMVTW